MCGWGPTETLRVYTRVHVSINSEPQDHSFPAPLRWMEQVERWESCLAGLCSSDEYFVYVINIPVLK